MICPNSGDEIVRGFLHRSGWAFAARTALPQDASTRCYERLSRDGQSAIFMRVPPDPGGPACPPKASDRQRRALGWNASARLSAGRVEAFAAIAGHLRGLGLSAPMILALDAEAGLALIEDFGPDVYARQIDQGADEACLYRTAAEALAIVHRAPCPDYLDYQEHRWPILEYDALALRIAVDLFAEWTPRLLGNTPMKEALRPRWENERNALIDKALTMPRSLTLRDYHAENLIWLDQRNGPARVGLLDFQDAVRGWGEWDMDLFIHDARRDAGQKAVKDAIACWLDLTGGERRIFDTRITILGTLNALRIAGIFSRLVLRDRKQRYRAFLGRSISILARHLRKKECAAMAALIAEILPGFIARAPTS